MFPIYGSKEFTYAVLCPKDWNDTPKAEIAVKWDDYVVDFNEQDNDHSLQRELLVVGCRLLPGIN